MRRERNADHERYHRSAAAQNNDDVSWDWPPPAGRGAGATVGAGRKGGTHLATRFAMNSNYQTRSTSDRGLLIGLLAGAAVGGGLALLFAPQEGASTRHALASRGQQAGRRISDAYGSMAAQARRRARALKTSDQRPEGSAPGAHASGDSTLVAGHTDERSQDPTRVIADAVGETLYTPAPVTPATSGPGATSPAPASPTWPRV